MGVQKSIPFFTTMRPLIDIIDTEGQPNILQSIQFKPKQMEIPKHIWSRWTDIYSRGDADKIAALADCHPNTVLNAIRNGRCKADLFEVMAKFYSERIALIDAIS